jgi:Tol biopolymer transport system component
MATVFLAHDEKHHREVAIKVLHAELAEVVGAERFLHEIKVTANLQHPHILGLIDSGVMGADEAGGRPYYVMPYVDGESLRHRLEREQQLPVGDAVRIASEVASALDYAHRHGVIHRDIKPENVLLHDGSAVVADFGIALAVSQAAPRLTRTGVSLGTPVYMSPEQATGERTITPRSDIYSLGVVTYEMLAGEPPFTGATAHAIIARMMTEEPRPLTTVRRHVPPHVAMAVSRALEKVAADRFASAHEFAEALNDPAFMAAPSRATAPSPGKLRTPMIYGAATVVALLVVTLVWGWTHPTRSKPVLRNNLTFDSTEAIAAGGAYVTRVAISPDGTRLAYIGGPRAQLMIRPRNQLHAAPVPGTEGDVSPFFSPDGQRIGVLNEGRLRMIPLGGGPPITVTEDRVGVAGASWGQGDFIYADGRGILASLVRVAARPGAKAEWFTALDTANSEIDHTWPDALPNGKGLLFTVTRAADNTSEKGRSYYIAVAEIPSGKHRILVNDAMYARYAASGHILYVTTGRTLMVVPFDQTSMKIVGEPTSLVQGVRLGSFGSADLAVSANGTLVYGMAGGQGKPELAWVTREGKSQSVDSNWLGFFHGPAISPDGKRLAVELSMDGTWSIWTKQLDHGRPVRLTLEGSGRGEPTWTPDGRSVTFGSYARDSAGLWTQRADGSAKAALQFSEKRGALGPRWSRDGKWLVFCTFKDKAGSGDILGIRPNIDTLPVALVATNFTEGSPDISPDGRWLAYTSNESGHDEVYVVPFPNTGSAKWQVSTRGGTEPVWAHSGRELFYRDGDANLVATAVRSNPTFAVGDAVVLFPAAGFRTGASRAHYAVAPDDRRFLMIPRSVSTADKLVAVENWFEELNAKARK